MLCPRFDPHIKSVNSIPAHRRQEEIGETLQPANLAAESGNLSVREQCNHNCTEIPLTQGGPRATHDRSQEGHWTATVGGTGTPMHLRPTTRPVWEMHRRTTTLWLGPSLQTKYDTGVRKCWGHRWHEAGLLRRSELHFEPRAAKSTFAPQGELKQRGPPTTRRPKHLRSARQRKSDDGEDVNTSPGEAASPQFAPATSPRPRSALPRSPRARSPSRRRPPSR